MKAGRKPGSGKWPGSGRKAGTLNKPKPGVGYVRELMALLGYDTFEEVVKILRGEAPCVACKGTRKVPADWLDPKSGKVLKRELSCQHCFGHGKEPVPVNSILRGLFELNQYQQPKLAQVHHTGLNDAQKSETLDDMLSAMHREISNSKKDA